MTLAEIYNSILNYYAAQFSVTQDELGPNIRVEAQVLAGALYLLYKYKDEAVKEVWPDTCSEEMLYRFGLLKPGRLPYSATAGEYEVQYTGGVTDEIIPASTVFKQNNGDGQYILDSNWVADGETGTFTVRALSSGDDTALAVGACITATNPLSAIDDEVEVTAISVTPLAGEDIDEYRELVLEEYQREPQGGSIGDYRSWAKDAQGVRRVYPYMPTPFEGTIDIYVEATTDDSDPDEPTGTPTDAILADVEEVLEMDPDTTLTDEQRMRRPLSVVGYNVQSVQTVQVDIEITNISDDSSTTKASITEDIESYLYDKRPYQGGVDGTTAADTIRSSDIERILLDYVTSYDSVVLKVDSTEVSTYTVGDSTNPTYYGEIPYLNAVTYVEE